MSLDLGGDIYCKYFDCPLDEQCKREAMERYYNKYGSLEGFLLKSSSKSLRRRTWYFR